MPVLPSSSKSSTGISSRPPWRPAGSPSNTACAASWAQSRCGPTTRSLSPPRPVASTNSATRCLRRSPPREPEVSRPRTFCVSVPTVGLTGSDFVSGVREARYAEVGAEARGRLPSAGSAGNTSRMAQREPDRFERALRQAWRSRASFAARRDAAPRELRLRRSERRRQRSRNVRTRPVSSCWIVPRRTRASSSSCSPWAAARWAESRSR